MTARDDGGDNGVGDAERWVQAESALDLQMMPNKGNGLPERQARHAVTCCAARESAQRRSTLTKAPARLLVCQHVSLSSAATKTLQFVSREFGMRCLLWEGGDGNQVQQTTGVRGSCGLGKSTTLQAEA
ncbi:hypothetical protein Bbelb_016710 [Branchiostoma belcheri]|nr:hypothetical protein Bbelb_016710 [Branchiostoma belcheri]